MKVSILQNSRLRHKFCARWNKTFGCKDVYMCGVACPFWGGFYVECLMNDKNYPLGEAIRQTLRESIDKGEGRRIIADIIKNKDKEYPGNWKERFIEEWMREKSANWVNNKGYSGE